MRIFGLWKGAENSKKSQNETAHSGLEPNEGAQNTIWRQIAYMERTVSGRRRPILVRASCHKLKSRERNAPAQLSK